MGISQRLWIAIALYLLFLSGSQLTNTKAIVLASDDSATNKSGPTNGLPLDHVGLVNNGESGVYLGNYHGKSWVLAANHSGPGSFELGGITYHSLAGLTHQLLNPDSTPSDIVLFQIDGDPGLPPLNLAPSSPTNCAQVYMIGFGQSGQPNRSYWIDQGGAWIPTVPGDPAANRIGYQWTGVQPGPEQWGVGSVVGSTRGINQTRAFCTRFLDQMNNACGTGGDSGGGVFIRQGHQWQLIGMLDALSGLANQPAGTSIFNGNINVIADLSQYRTEIDAILLPERARHP
jgi:Trypsin-like peptidase domain